MNKKFNEIYFTTAEKEILEDMKAGKNFEEICKGRNKEKSTLQNQLCAIYNKTKDVVEYRSKLRRFLTLQHFLTDSDAQQTEVRPAVRTTEINPLYRTMPNIISVQKVSDDDEINRLKFVIEGQNRQNDLLKEENKELKAKIKKLETTPPRADFEVFKNNIKAQIENLSQKLRLIEELEELMKTP